jgi:outer membrane receptor protein involved in Fe transport
LNSFLEEGTVSDYYSARLFSEWTENFSTEVRYSRSDVNDVQGPVGGGEAQSDNPIVRLAVGVVGPSANGLLSTGPSIFRSANALEQQIDQYKVKANLLSGNHSLTIGAELNRLQAYNLFAINATGTLFFRNLADFREGLLSNGAGAPSGFTGANDVVDGTVNGGAINATPTGDINEAAATFNRSIYSFYAQDKWQLTDQLNVILGGRVDWYDGDAPRVNTLFQQRYGFTNAVPFSKFDPLFFATFRFHIRFI